MIQAKADERSGAYDNMKKKSRLALALNIAAVVNWAVTVVVVVIIAGVQLSVSSSNCAYDSTYDSYYCE